MESVLQESKSEKVACSPSCCAAACEEDIQEAVRQIEKRVHIAKDAVSAKLDAGKMASARLVKRSRFAIENCIDDTAQAVKRRPIRSVAIAFAAGAALTFVVPRFIRK